MFDALNAWYRRYLSDPQAVLLFIILLISIFIFWAIGKILAPLFAAIIIAYLLEGPTYKLESYRAPRLLAVSVVFLAFLAFMTFLLLGLFPILSRQLSTFFQEMPEMIVNGQELLLQLPSRYPGFISPDTIWDIINAIKEGVSSLGHYVLSMSASSIPAIVTLSVYLILVPLMVFFLMKDKTLILAWMSRFLPAERKLVHAIWDEMDAQIGNYIRGKFYEIVIVGGVAYILFAALGLNYSPLLAILVGLSVLIPYIGATVVTFPVLFVGYFQWGLGADLAWLTIWYLALQFADGSVLVPILFSEAVNLHPVAIIAAVLIFGGMWGFWGVFFAIPLATLVKAIINIWPTSDTAESIV